LEAPVDEGVSPGRLSWVFVWPGKAYGLLANKPPLWNIRTLSGLSKIPETRKRKATSNGDSTIDKKRTLKDLKL
jgi:hypothetical protein